MWKMSWIKNDSQAQGQPEQQHPPLTASNNVDNDLSRGDQDPGYDVVASSPNSAIERTHPWGSDRAYMPSSPLAVAMPPQTSASGSPRPFMVHSSTAPNPSTVCSVGSSQHMLGSSAVLPPVSPVGIRGGMKRKDSFVSTNGRMLGAGSGIVPSTMADGRLDFLSLLPYEIAMVIVIYADFPAITTIAEVSRSWNRFARDNAVWRRLFLQQSEWRTPRALAAAGRTSLARRRLFRGNCALNGTVPQSPGVCASGASTPRVGDGSAYNGHGSAMSLDEDNAHQILTAYAGSSLRPAIALQHMIAPSPTISSAGSFKGEFDGQRLVGAKWKYLFQQRLELDRHWAKGIAEVQTITGHADSVYCVQYDREKIVTGSRDRTIKVWDSQTLQCMRTLTGHEASVLCLKYDKQTLVTGSSDSTVIVWDWPSGLPMQRLVSHTAGVLDVAFDSEHVVSCSKDCTIKVWLRSTGKLLRTMIGHRGPVNAVQLYGGRIVSASGDSLIKMWDLKTGELLRTFAGHTRGLACVQFDGKTIVSGSSDQLIKVWDADTGHCVQTLKGHKDLVRTLHFTGGRRAVSGSYDQTIKVWDIVSGECVLDLKDVHTSWVFDVQFSTSRIVSTSQDQKIIIWDFSKGLDVADID